MSAPRRGVVLNVLISTRQYPVVHVGPLIHIRLLRARYKSISLMIHTMSNYRGSIEVPHVSWLDEPRGYDVLDSEAHLQFMFTFGYGSSVDTLFTFISQSGRARIVHGTQTCTGALLVLYQLHANR